MMCPTSFVLDLPATRDRRASTYREYLHECDPYILTWKGGKTFCWQLSTVVTPENKFSRLGLIDWWAVFVAETLLQTLRSEKSIIRVKAPLLTIHLTFGRRSHNFWTVGHVRSTASKKLRSQRYGVAIHERFIFIVFL